MITISKSNVKVVLERTGVLICDHFIENISFASGGEKVIICSSFVIMEFSLQLILPNNMIYLSDYVDMWSKMIRVFLKIYVSFGWYHKRRRTNG